MASTVLVGLVGVVLILAGSLKLIGVGAEDMVEGLEKAGLIQHMTLISITAIICGVLLLVPLTRKIGILAASAYWGGAIVAHLTYDDSVIMPASFQAILWIGALLGSSEFRSRFPTSKRDNE
ncbi:MAG: hypothetical protein AAF456_04685 [Planctomycetota bacterium]